MTAIALPTSLPPAAPDYALADAAVRQLDRRPAAASWGWMKTVLLAAPSLGLLPLLVWPIKFREVAAEEAEMLNTLALWAEQRGRAPRSIAPLKQAANRARPSPFPIIVSVLAAVLVVGAYVVAFRQAPGFSLDRLLHWTYYTDFFRHGAMSHRDVLYLIWQCSLGVGFAVQWHAIGEHRANVRRFIGGLNPVLEAEWLAPVAPPRDSRGAWIRRAWVLLAVVLCFYHAFWAIPMALAGMAQRRYTESTAPCLRRELARRVRDAVVLRPLSTPAQPAPPRCQNQRCLAPVRASAAFCARCGTPKA